MRALRVGFWGLPIVGALLLTGCPWQSSNAPNPTGSASPSGSANNALADSSCTSETQVVQLAAGSNCPSPVAGASAAPGGSLSGSGSSPAPVAQSSPGACSAPGTSPYPGMSLVWDEEFDYTGPLDPSKWTYNPGPFHPDGNEYNTTALANSSVAPCQLTITAIYDPSDAAQHDGLDYTSAKVRTIASWTYGRFDVSAKLPCGTGTWPAIWMLPENSIYGGWPNSGEIDILELKNGSPWPVASIITGTNGPSWLSNQTEVDTTCSAFHLYSMYWTPTQIQLMVDNHAYTTYPGVPNSINYQDSTVWPYNEPFYFILEIQIGGCCGGTPDPSVYPQTMQIQYARVYQ
jgi:beta-glucanase (GH16 family)